MCKRSDAEYPFGHISKDSFRSHWDKMRDALGFSADKDYVPHMLRHTCATRLVVKEVPLPQVMLWMGHTNIATTMRYSHLVPKDLDLAAKALMRA